ncbi:MAG: S-layer homology domain-containing protein, partial [Tissierellia bacterium]|nr:S-layer homology domain-containing protein [Tissierellia bacterium]
VAPQRWDPTLPKLIEVDTTFNALYMQDTGAGDPDIIGPVDPDDPDKPDKPDGYVTVRFLKGEHGTLSIPGVKGLATVEYYVNPNAGKTMANITPPVIAPDSKHQVADPAWLDNAGAPLNTATEITGDLEYTAQYTDKKNDAVVPAPKPHRPSRPSSGHVVVVEDKKEMEGIHYAYIFGYPNGTVRPDGQITRAEAAAMLARLKGLALDNASAPNFTDTKSNAAWYNKVINAIVKEGIMQGYPDGSFKPDAPITRAEFAQMILPIDKPNDAVAPFADVQGHWAIKAINQGYGNERLHGYPDGTFKPNGNITRAEAAKILNSLFDRKITEEGLKDLENPSEIKYFPDLTKSHWAYYEMLEATNSHSYYRLEKGKVDEGWIRILDILKH